MMNRIVIALSFLAVFSTSQAADYVLPSGTNVALAQLQSLPNYDLVCDSNTAVDSLCTVDPGEYQLVVFDGDWAATQEIVTVESGSGESESPMSLVTESCFGAPNTKLGCTAFCPSDTVATGGACDVSEGYSVSSVAGEKSYRCPTSLPPNDDTVGVTATVYCLSTK